MPWVSATRLGRDREFGAYKRQPAPAVNITEEGEETIYYGSDSRPPPPPPFQFGYKRQPIDWRILHGIDIDRMVRETDIETLERCVGAVAFGDLEAEDSRNLTEVNFMRIFRLGQLTAEYLLHVQDRLAYDNCLLKDEKARKEKHLEAMRLRCREHHDALASAKQDIRRLKKTIKTLEISVQQEQPVAVPAPVPQPPLPAPAPVDSGATWKLERLERRQQELQVERSSLLQEVAKLKSALAKRDSEGKTELESTVSRIQAEERKSAQQRLRLAQSEVQELRRKLDQMANKQLEIQSLHRECRQLELQKAKDSTAAGLEETVHSLTSKQRGHAEALRRLKATLHEKEEALQGREEALRKAQDELTEQGELLEDTEARAEEEAARADSAADEAGRAAEDAAKAEARIRHLERQLEEATQELDTSSAAVQDVGALQQDIDELKDKVRRLKEEHERIKAENSGLRRENSAPDGRLQTLSRQEAEEEEQRQLDREEAKSEEAEERRRAVHRRSASVPSTRARSPPRVPAVEPASLPPPSVSRPWAADDAPPLPPIAERAKWQQERPHEMRPWDRPGVLSRTNVTRPIFLAQRPEIQDLLETELEEELRSYGIDPQAERLTNEEYEAAVAELENRQAATAADSSPQMAARTAQIRNILAWHLHKTADLVDKEFTILPNGQVAAQQKPRLPARMPVTAPRQASRSVSPKRSGLLGKLCSRFKSPSSKERRHQARLDQAAAIAAYRETYGHDGSGRGALPPTAKDLEKRDLKEASERFYQPLRTGTLSQEQFPSPAALTATQPRPKAGRGQPAQRSRSPVKRGRCSPRSPKIEMTTIKKVGPSKPHGTIRPQATESLSRQETYSEFEEDTDLPQLGPEAAKPATRTVTRRKVTEVKEVVEPHSARREHSDAEVDKSSGPTKASKAAREEV